ncbi:MAG: MerC domain-containing protein [Oligoflexus sp.]
MSKANHTIYDKLGIFASSSCLIHCLSAPALIILLPASGRVIEHELFHLLVLLVVAPVAVFALYRGYVRHQSKAILSLGILGLSLLILGIHSEQIQNYLETMFSLTGSAALVVAHTWNMKRMRCLPGHRHQEHKHAASQ